MRLEGLYSEARSRIQSAACRQSEVDFLQAMGRSKQMFQVDGVWTMMLPRGSESYRGETCQKYGMLRLIGCSGDAGTLLCL